MRRPNELHSQSTPAQAAQAAQTVSSPSGSRATAVHAVLLGAAVCASHAGILGAPFVFDDIPRIERAAPATLALWPPDGWLLGTQRPLVQGTLALNHALGGLDPRGYHAFNLLVHAAAAVALFLLLRCALARLALRGIAPVPATWCERVSLAAAAIWALHPVATSVTGPVVQRAESLAVLCTTVAAIALVSSSARSGAARSWRLAASVGCVALALLSKPTAVAAPFLLVLLDVFIVTGSWRRTLAERWGAHACNLALLFVLVLLGTAEGALFGDGRVAGYGPGVAGIGPLDHLALSGRAVGLYAALVFDPRLLAIDRGPDALAPMWMALVGWTIVATTVSALVVACVRAAWWGALVAAAVVPLVPTTSIVPLADAAVDHRLYGPLAAVVAGATLCVAALAARRFLAASRWIPLALQGGLAVVMLLEIAAVAARCRAFRDPVALWTQAVERSPLHARAFVNRAGLLLERADADPGVLGLASEDLAHAERLAPGRPVLLVNQAILDLRRGDAARAIERLDIATKGMRADHAVLGARGDALRALGRFGEAGRNYLLAAERAPGEALYPLLAGNAFSEEGDDAAAIAAYGEAIARARAAGSAGLGASAAFNLGNLCYRRGEFADAARRYRDALAADAAHEGAREWLPRAEAEARASERARDAAGEASDG